MSPFHLRGLPRAALWIGATLALCTPVAYAADSDAVRLQKQLDQTKQELSDTQQQVRDLNQRMDTLQQQAPAATAPTTAAQMSSSSPTARLAPVNIDNHAISFVVDTTF
jgi:uncharacterized protein YlxW (UPF0749 family)